jgi:Ca2+-binding RTX toxin-like protein
VNGASADFTSTTGSTVNIKTFDDPDGNTVVGDGVHDTITGVVIQFGASSSGLIDLTQPLQPSYSVGGHTYTITEHADGSIDVSGVFGNNTGTTTIAVFTNDGYNSVEYTWVADQTFKIGNFGAAVPSTDPVDFSVPVQVVDGDSDTASGNLNIDLLSGTSTQDHSADLAGNTYTSTAAQPNIIGSGFADTLNGDGAANTLFGGAGIDTLNGLGGNDTLIGHADGDTLNGGLGNDKFVLQVSTLGHDTIGDFVSGTDQIFVDIGSGLTLNTAATLSATNFHTGDETVAATWNGGTGNEFVFNATSHELWFSANGTGTDKIDIAHMSTGVPAATDVHTF